jgi:hypothetical protein
MSDLKTEKETGFMDHLCGFKEEHFVILVSAIENENFWLG